MKKYFILAVFAAFALVLAGCNMFTQTDAAAPSSPSGLRADSSVGSTIDLIWETSTSQGIAGYNVYRSAASGTGYSKIATIKRGRAFWDTGVTLTTSETTAWAAHNAGTGVVFYPAPFNPSAETACISYLLKTASNVSLVIYDVLGKVVWDVSYVEGAHGGMVGINKISWDGKDNHGHDLPNGIYPIRLWYVSSVEADYALIWDGTSGLTTGTTYYYVVTAFNASGVESDYSEEASAEARSDGTTHWPVRLNPQSDPADPLYEYDPTLPTYR